MTFLKDKVLNILREQNRLSEIMAKSILSLSVTWSRVDVDNIRPGDERRLMVELEKGIRLYMKDPAHQEECIGKLNSMFSSLSSETSRSGNGGRPTLVKIINETDIVVVRGIGRNIIQDLGFSLSIQIKVATAISELARNIVQYAGTGEISLTQLISDPRGIEVVASDKGPGIPNIDHILGGGYRSRTGMGMGLIGTKNLMDEFDIKTAPGQGTIVTVRKFL